MLTSLLERFGYGSLAAARAESAEIVRLCEIVRLGTPPEPEGEVGDGWVGE